MPVKLFCTKSVVGFVGHGVLKHLLPDSHNLTDSFNSTVMAPLTNCHIQFYPWPMISLVMLDDGLVLVDSLVSRYTSDLSSFLWIWRCSPEHGTFMELHYMDTSELLIKLMINHFAVKHRLWITVTLDHWNFLCQLIITFSFSSWILN